MDLEILKIASDTENHKFLKNCTHSSKGKNPLCGDEMKISLKVKNNEIIDFAYQCKSCIYCQASASILSKFSINKSLEKITEITDFLREYFQNTNVKFPQEWKQFEKLFKEKNISRKECILLPFKTLAKALKS
jgi:nitrogen fixation NifU-like protein